MSKRYTCLAWWMISSNIQKYDKNIFLFLSNNLDCLVISLIHKIPAHVRQNIMLFIGSSYLRNDVNHILMKRHAIVFTPPNIISYYKYIKFDNDHYWLYAKSIHFIKKT